MNCLTKLGLACLLIASSAVSHARIMPDSSKALMIANRAKSLVGQRSQHPQGHTNTEDRRRANRGSDISNREQAGCGGIAIGNIRLDRDRPRPHQTVVIVNGAIINANNRC